MSKNALPTQKKKSDHRTGQYLRPKAAATLKELQKALSQQGVVPNIWLGEILVGEGLVSEEQLQLALSEQRKNRKLPLGQMLVEQGLITQNQIQQCIAKKLGIPFVDLNKYQIDENVLKLVPKELINKYKILPLHTYENKLVLAMENPMQWEPLEAVRFFTNLNIEPVIASQVDLQRAINQYITSANETVVSFSEFEALNLDDFKEEFIDDKYAHNDSVIARLVNTIIVGAHQKNASDIHIEPYSTQAKTLVRIRKDGTMSSYYEIPAQLRSAIVARIKIMAGLNIAEKRKPQDGKIDFKKFSNLDIELRVATLPTVGEQEDVVIRILSGGEPIKVDDLSLSVHNKKTMLRLISKPYGLFFVCGPTGSGKTTTLHSILGFLNTDDRKIWTAEDPVEITQKGLRQVQVLPKIGLNFAAAMRAFLRADPDIIMIGEMRDAETTKMGVEASLTGHLVFSTLHTNSAPESIMRLLDMGMDPFNFADALIGVLAQRLAKRLCTSCKEAYEPDEMEVTNLATEYCYELSDTEEEISALQSTVIDDWRKRFTENDKFMLNHAIGCDQCDYTGYSGRVGIHELLEATDTIKHKIFERAQVSALRTAALSEGMRTLKQDGIEKVIMGITDIQQIRKVCIK